MQQTEHAQAVLAWRESLVTLNDTHFFELLRMYLGEIKTPYNKQKLIEELSAFLRKDENANMIVRLLSVNDILILSAIKILNLPTQEKLSQFFSTDFSFAELYERLMNLEERLLIYRKTEQKQIRFVLNPLLEPKIEPLLSVSVLMPSGSFSGARNTVFEPSSIFFASIFSIFFHYKDLCKSDGTLKKKGENLIASVFPFVEQADGKEIFQLVFDGLKNLQLLVQQGADYAPNMERWKQFAALDDAARLCYLCAASCSHFSNEMLLKYAQFVFSLCSSVPQGGFSYPVLMRLALLQCEQASEPFPLKKGRLASLLEDIKPAKTDGIETGSDLPLSVELSTVVKQIIKMKLLVESDGVFVRSEFFDMALQNHNSDIKADLPEMLKGRLSLNPDFSAALIPGADLSEMLPLMQILCITRYDTVPVFEISKQSCSSAFDCGMSTVEIKKILQSASAYEISQSIDFSLEEWEHAYNSVSLYKGYVLKVDKEKRAVIESSRVLKPYLLATLADGVYLFDFIDDEQAGELLKKSGLEYMGAVKTSRPERHPLPFSALKNGGSLAIKEPEQQTLPKRERDSLLNALYAELENRHLPEEQADGLRSRIRRKIIVNANQLRGESVRFERIEAGGMDFLGKVHVIDHAISTGSMIEISFDGESERIVGTPVGIEKNEGDALLKLCVEPEKKIRTVSVSRAGFIKRIRGAIFKEI